ncbi:hypothetical protein FF1_031814 [Malus domestica]
MKNENLCVSTCSCGKYFVTKVISELLWTTRFLINFRAVMLDVYLYNSSCLIGFPDSSEAQQGLSNWLLMGLRFHHQMSEKEERD